VDLPEFGWSDYATLPRVGTRRFHLEHGAERLARVVVANLPRARGGIRTRQSNSGFDSSSGRDAWRWRDREVSRAGCGVLV